MRTARPAGLTLAALAAVLWAVGVTVLQPLTDPIGPWPENLPGNNAYWVRDLRFSMIVAAVLGLVLAGGGDRRWSDPAVLLGGLWIAADVAVDRLDPTGAGPTVLLAVAGWAAVAGAAAIGVRGQRRDGPGGPASGTPADARLPPRRALATAASVAGVLVLVAAGIQSPSDTERELDLAAVATGLLLAVLAIGCALAAAPARTVARWRLAAGLGATVTVAVGLVRAVPPVDRLLPQLALGAVLLTGVTLLAWDWPGGRPVWRWHAVAALAAFIAPYAMLLVTVLFTLPLKVGASFTALAGNSAINAADSDVLLSLCGVLAGLGMALLLAWPPALGQRPAPGDPPGPEAPPGPREASAERR